MKNSPERSKLNKMFGISEVNKKINDENENLMNLETNLLESTK